ARRDDFNALVPDHLGSFFSFFLRFFGGFLEKSLDFFAENEEQKEGEEQK
ncbi:10503_t:CDS:1, partial [Racocetra persica]